MDLTLVVDLIIVLPAIHSLIGVVVGKIILFPSLMVIGYLYVKFAGKMDMGIKEYVRRIQELRRSNASRPITNKRKYTRKIKHKKALPKD
jgi:hypothetical protein